MAARWPRDVAAMFNFNSDLTRFSIRKTFVFLDRLIFMLFNNCANKPPPLDKSREPERRVQ